MKKALALIVILAAAAAAEAAGPLTCTPPPSGLVNWWPANSNTTDIVSGNNGILEGGVTYSAGEVGEAFNFDGSTGFVATSTLVTNPQTFTLCLWFKTSSSDGGVLMSFDTSQTAMTGGEYDRNIYMGDAGAVHFGVWNSGAKQVSSATGYNNNEWHLVAGSLSPMTGLSLYMDGSLVGNDPSVTSASEIYNGYWRIGEDDLLNWPYQPASYFFNGQIDAVSVFDVALSSSEVAAIYAAGSEGMCINQGSGVAPLVTWTNPVPSVSYGTALGASQLNAVATYASTNVAGSFSYTPASGTVPNPGVNILTAVFTPTDTLVYNTVTDIVALVVTPTNVPAGAQTNSTSAFTFTTFAGEAPTGDADGVGSDALFNNPAGVAVGTNGYLYIVDSGNNTIRQLTPDGVVTTIAGFPELAGSADGTNKAARFNAPSSITADGSGNLFVTDLGNDTIRRLAPAGTNWVVSTIAGAAGAVGTNDGVGTNALFLDPACITTDGLGNLYVTSVQSYGATTYTGTRSSLRKLSLVNGNWTVTTIASVYEYASAPVLGAYIPYYAVAADKLGNVYVFIDGTIEEMTPAGASWTVTTIAGQPGANGSGTADGEGTNAQFLAGSSMAVDSAGNLYLADANRIRKITPAAGNWDVSTLAGSVDGGSADGTGTNAGFNTINGVAEDSAGNVYAADSGNNTIRRVTALGVVWTLAGRAGSAGSADGLGTTAQFNKPSYIAEDSSGNLYVTDSGNFTIRQINPSGQVDTLAGMAGTAGNANGIGSYARFDNPFGITADRLGNLYVADDTGDYGGDFTIRQITPEGLASAIAGLAGKSGLADGVGTNALFSDPRGIIRDAAGNLYVTDGNAIRMMTLVGTNWNVTTIAGSYYQYVAGPYDGLGTNARFSYPSGIAVDSAGNLYVADWGNLTIREITPVGTNWLVTTIAGSIANRGNRGETGIALDGDGIGTTALFGDLGGIAVDSAGNLYVAEAGAETVREVSPAAGSWVVTTIGGLALLPGSEDGLGRAARFNGPQGIVCDQTTGNLYIVDGGNNTIREGIFSQYTPAQPPVSSTQPANNATLVVTLLPAAANGQWRFPWEQVWRASGTAATNLVPNQNYPVEFSPVPGYLAAPAMVTNFVAGGQVNYLTGQYYPTITSVDTNSGGSLEVIFQANPPAGSGWRLLGSTNAFFPSGFTTNLLPGDYLIQCAALANFSQIPILSVQISSGTPTVVQETYQPSQAPPAGFLLPGPVPPSEISDLNDYPYGFNGQLQTDVGYGSGVAVEANVVLTAAHLIFNDETLSYVSQAWWFPQEDAPQFVPEPRQAQGWLVLSGYAAQRITDILTNGYIADQSSPQSRNFDVAALYFPSVVAGGGYGGCLPSDATPNPWLTGNSEKMLVGYPVDGSEFGVDVTRGAMYEAGPQPYALSLDTEPVNDQQVYTATWFLSYPGNSGGPLYVQLNGYYYPAGVYLGTLLANPYASAVRAIDGEVVNLITNAQAVVTTGVNNSGGGVVTITPSLAINGSNPGYLVLQLGPAAAVQAGAAWKLTNQPAADYSSANPSLQEITSSNALVVQFKPVPGWNLPPNQSVTLTPGVILTNKANYSVANPVLTMDSVRGLGISGTTNTSYQIQSNITLTGGTWVSFKTNSVITNGFNLITNKPLPGFYRALWLTNG